MRRRRSRYRRAVGRRIDGLPRRLALLAGLGVVLWLGALGARPAQAQDVPSIEYQVKASYLYNFLQFVRWPDDFFASNGGTFAVCLLGEDRFGVALDAIAGAQVWGQRAVIVRLTRIEEATRCHALFVSASEAPRARRILDASLRPGLLVVGESAGFAEAGGIINLVRIDDKIRFEVNRRAAAEAGLEISAQLLALAVHVYE